MSNFDIESHLNKIYATFPETHRRPVIGITANYADTGDATVITNKWSKRAVHRLLFRQ